MAKLEELAKEIESIHDRTEELAPLAQHAREESYDRGALLQELYDARLGFFAHKLEIGYYDQNAEGYAQHMAQLSADQQTEEIAKEALKDEASQVAQDTVDLCEECGARLDSELHQAHTQTDEAVSEPEDAEGPNPPSEEDRETVPTSEVGQNIGTEDRPVTPPPTDPSEPAQAEAPQTNDVPPAEQAGGDVEQPHSPQGMTTSDTLMFAPDAPESPQTEEIAEPSPQVDETPNIEEPSRTEAPAPTDESLTLTLTFSSAQEREAALNKLRDESYNVS